MNAPKATVEREFWRNRRVLVTGHSGFKGSWLCAWLSRMGANVAGYALEPPTTPALFDLLGLEKDLVEHCIADIRDLVPLSTLVQRVEPEVVFHLAAQPLVRASYREPVETVETNIMGTVNLLQALRASKHVRAAVFITTDKVYENREWQWGYREVDRLGGYDPYSASKAASEIVIAAFRRSFFGSNSSTDQRVAIATARAGNVLGGGDWSEDRIIPDAVRAFSRGRPLEIRNPEATRPWQHVLEPLAGYLMLAQKLYEASQDPDRAKINDEKMAAFNFGPGPQGIRPVREIVDLFSAHWPGGAQWQDTGQRGGQPHEAGLLSLDAAKAQAHLGWDPRLDLETALKWTAKWYWAYARSNGDSAELRDLTAHQIDAMSDRH